MPKLSLSVYLNAYSDRHPSNAPDRNNFKWNRDINSCLVNNPTNQANAVAPGETLPIFSGMRTLLQDGTTQYSLALAPFQTSIYALSWVGGTAPNFRTPRTTGADATTQVNVSVNGPTVTFTSGLGTYASFTGQLPGMISPVTITANSIGTVGNAVVLTGDGTSTIATLIANWNTANPSNQVTLTLGNGAQIPSAGIPAQYTGTILGTATPVTITANNNGSAGNSVLLVGDGASSISALISAWNIANPSNQITLSAGDGTQIPLGGAFAFFTGTPAGCATIVTITADAVGTNGNNVELIGDGVSSIAALIANWNIANPSNPVSLTSGNGGQVPLSGTLIDLATGINPAMVALAGGVSSSLQLAGGASATAFNLLTGGVVVGDQVTIASNFNQLNQGTFQIIGVTANSFTVEIPTGTNEGPILLGSGFATQVAIFSSGGVQVGDTLVISGGFSLASQASYQVTAVFAESVQFSSTNVLPQEGPVMTEAIAIYSSAKTLVYIEADGPLNVILNGVDIGQIEPFVIPNAAQPSLPPEIVPGIFMLKSTIYSLSVQNNGLNVVNTYFAAVE
jgi:hypothetical protein